MSAKPKGAGTASGDAPKEDSMALRQRLKTAADAKDIAAGAAALLSLAESDPSAFRDPALQKSAAVIAEGSGTAADEHADRIYFVLSSKLGSDGLDVLYETYALGGLSRGGARAGAVIGRPPTLERATPAMRIAFELRRASCQHKPYLFPRAGDEGDARSLTQLEALQPPQCHPLSGACCFKRHGDLDKAIAALKQRGID